MDRRNRKIKRNIRLVNWGIMCLHAFVSLVLSMFIIIWLLRGLGYESYRILSGSMEPILITGEIVLVNTNDVHAKVGEVIAFQIGDHVVIHRVVEILADGSYVTKGDANVTNDLRPVEQWQILGTMWIKLGILTHIWLLFTSKGSMLAAVVLVMFYIIFDTSRNRKEEGEVGYA